MTQVLIDRELLERLEHVTRNLVPHLQCHADLVEALASPRQPDGEAEGLEVVAWQDADNPLYTTGERRQMHGWATDGYPIVELCRLSDAKRAIAELREELDAAGEILAQQGRRNTELRAERDTLAAPAAGQGVSALAEALERTAAAETAMRTILDFSDSEMRDGDAARDIALDFLNTRGCHE